MQPAEIVVVEADLGRADHRDAVRSMTAAYAPEASFVSKPVVSPPSGGEGAVRGG